jgi:hypothetical protein
LGPIEPSRRDGWCRRCTEIARRWPGLNLRFVIDSNANRLNQLKRGACDLAFVFPHEVGLELDSKLVETGRVPAGGGIELEETVR